MSCRSEKSHSGDTETGRSRRAALAHLGLFTLSFVVACGLIRYLLPAPDVPVLSEKLEYFHTHRDEYDTLFVGSSRIFRQIVPEIFDSETARMGLPVQSFNFGVQGMLAPETFVALDRILSPPPARLKTIILEPTAFDWNPDEPDTLRFMDWHRPWETLLALRTVFHYARKSKSASRFSLCQLHLRAALARATNLGLVAAAWSATIEEVSSEDKLTADLIHRQSGFVALDQIPGERDRHEKFLEEQDVYEKRLAKYEKPLKKRRPATAEITAYREVVERVRRRGIRVVFLSPPGEERSEVVLALHKDVPLDPFLDFNDPAKFPALFNVAYRFDEGHLNERGAEEFTRLLAVRLFPYLSK